MASAKLIRLLNGLKQATAQGKLVWEDTADEDLFRVILANGIVLIGPETGGKRFLPPAPAGEGSAYVVTLLNERNQVVEVFRAGDEDPERRLVEELYLLARRSSRGGEELLDRMLAEIERRA